MWQKLKEINNQDYMTAYNAWKNKRDFQKILDQVILEQNTGNLWGELVAMQDQLVFPAERYYTVLESLSIMQEWFDVAKLDVETFACAMTSLVTGSNKKKGMLLLQGPPSTGKTFLLDPLADLVRKAGSVGMFTCGHESRFMFEPLLGALMGYMSEGMLAPTTMEQFKSALSDDTVAIEQKGGKVVQQERIPLIGSTNHELWKTDPSQKQAMLDRVFLFMTPGHMSNWFRENPVLGEDQKKLNPRAYLEIIKHVVEATNNKGDIYNCACGEKPEDTLFDLEFLIAEVGEVAEGIE